MVEIGCINCFDRIIWKGVISLKTLYQYHNVVQFLTSVKKGKRIHNYLKITLLFKSYSL